MKALAITRSSISESYEDQRKVIAAYAESEKIELIHLDIRADDNFENIRDSLSKVDAVIVTDLTRVTRNMETLNSFKQLLEQNNIKLISLSDKGL